MPLGDVTELKVTIQPSLSTDLYYVARVGGYSFFTLSKLIRRS